jgi:hypothetical protein
LCEHVFVNARRSEEGFWAAKSLLADGLTHTAVAQELAIPRGTIRYWTTLHHPPGTSHLGRAMPSLDGWRPTAHEEYSYLLGLYLGDGCIAETSDRCRQLVLTLDASYPDIVRGAMSAVHAVVPGSRARANLRQGCVAVCCCHPVWPIAFPQHGRGRKHLRPIRLADWQRELTHRHPRAFLRGLYHSDGSRVINRFDTQLPSGRLAHYEYTRYFFTNYSADIRGLFCEHCHILGIRSTQSSFKNISVSHRDSVALLDEFLGPKS